MVEDLAQAPSAPRPRPPHWCDLCSALYVRFTDAGDAYCWWHWWDHVLGAWARQSGDAWSARQVLETMLRAARPLTQDRIVDLVSYHPLRGTHAEERAGAALRIRAGVHEALGELVARGRLACDEGGYRWSDEAQERLHG